MGLLLVFGWEKKRQKGPEKFPRGIHRERARAARLTEQSWPPPRSRSVRRSWDFTLIFARGSVLLLKATME